MSESDCCSVFCGFNHCKADIQTAAGILDGRQRLRFSVQGVGDVFELAEKSGTDVDLLQLGELFFFFPLFFGIDQNAGAVGGDMGDVG